MNEYVRSSRLKKTNQGEYSVSDEVNSTQFFKYTDKKKPRGMISHFREYISLKLCLVFGKFEGKCKGKKIERKNRRKEKSEENKK